RVPRTPRAKQQKPALRAWKTHLPQPYARVTHRTRLKELLVQVDPDILSLHGLSSSHGPEHACWNHGIISGVAIGRRPFHLIRDRGDRRARKVQRFLRSLRALRLRRR